MQSRWESNGEVRVRWLMEFLTGTDLARFYHQNEYPERKFSTMPQWDFGMKLEKNVPNSFNDFESKSMIYMWRVKIKC